MQRYPPGDPERRRWQDPDRILDQIGLQSGETMADLGCGDGFFALPAATRVGPGGKIYGVDLDREALNRLAENAKSQGLFNIETIPGRAEEIVICEQCVDLVFFGICLHDFQDPALVLRNARTMIHPEGRLVDLDWKAESMDLGPPLSIRFSIEHARGLIEGAGFRVISEREAGPHHYCITAVPLPIGSRATRTSGQKRL